MSQRSVRSSCTNPHGSCHEQVDKTFFLRTVLHKNSKQSGSMNGLIKFRTLQGFTSLVSFSVTMKIPMVITLGLNVIFMPVILVTANASFQCPKAFWIFGDSLSDTGNTQAIFPSLSVLHNPYGISYNFRDKPGHNRYSDGRLVVDFTAQAFDWSFFGTYGHALNGENYSHGANFAYAGAQARSDSTITPFYLQLQIEQFVHFKSFASNQGPYVKGFGLPVSGAFSEGAYFIPEIGGDDFYVSSFVSGLSPNETIQNVVPVSVAAVQSAIITLHDSGARLFILFNVPPQGCNPAQLTVLSAYSNKDSLGCLNAYNAIDQAYDAQLKQVVNSLQSNYSGDGTRFYLFDYYNATIEILSNPATYGFNNTMQACCGYGGAYNYNTQVSCGNNGTVTTTNGTTFVDINTACATPQTYVQWDGIHYTQAFYRQIAKFFLTGRFVNPALNLTAECSLDFEDF